MVIEGDARVDLRMLAVAKMGINAPARRGDGWMCQTGKERKDLQTAD